MRQHLKLIIVFAISFICLIDSCQGVRPTGTNREGQPDGLVGEPEPAVIDDEQVQTVISYDLESSPLYEEIEEFLNDEQNAWMRHRHIGFCGTPVGEAENNFSWIIRYSPPEHIIPLLHHESVHLRNVIIKRLTEIGDDAITAINDAFENGSARIKLELLILIHPDVSPEDYYELLDEIIHDESLTLFYEDLYPMRFSSVDRNVLLSVNSPIDILTYYMRLMKESDFDTDRGIAAMRLGDFGEVADVAVPALIELLEGEDGPINTIWGFFSIGVYATNLRGAAAIALGKIGPSALEAIPSLVDALDDEVPQTRYAAASSLYMLGHNQAEMIEYLVDLLNEEVNESSYEIIANHLGRIGPDAIDALPRLEELIAGTESSVRTSARKAVVLIRDGGEELELQLLLAGLSNADPDIRLDSVRELGRWNWESDEVLAALYGMLDDENGDVKWAACSDLLNYGYGGPLGPDPDRIYDACVEILNGIPDTNHATDVAHELRHLELDLPEAIPGLLQVMESHNPPYMSNAIEAILAVGGTYEIIGERLLELAQHEDWQIAKMAVQKLISLDLLTIDALPVFNDNLVNERARNLRQLTQDAAATLIGNIAANNETAVPGLVEILECGNSLIVIYATSKLIEITGDYDPIVDRLIELLDHESRLTVLEAIKALGSFGEHAKSALPKLREIAESGSGCTMRDTAQAAIESIM